MLESIFTPSEIISFFYKFVCINKITNNNGSFFNGYDNYDRVRHDHEVCNFASVSDCRYLQRGALTLSTTEKNYKKLAEKRFNMKSEICNIKTYDSKTGWTKFTHCGFTEVLFVL